MVSCFSCQTIQVITLREETIQRIEKNWTNFPIKSAKHHIYGETDSTFADYRTTVRKYPQFLGIKPSSLQDTINQRIKRKFFQYNLPHLQGWPKWPSVVDLNTRPEWYSSYTGYKVYSTSRKLISLTFFWNRSGGRGAGGGFGYSEHSMNVDLSSGKFLNIRDFFERISYPNLREIILQHCKNKVISSIYKKYGAINLDYLHFAITKKYYHFFFRNRGIIDGIAKVKIPKKVLRKYVNKKYRKL